jgi:hypothetical protein
MNEKLTDFATRYAAAWSSQNAASLASFYAENGSLIVNSGTPSVGRAAARILGYVTSNAVVLTHSSGPRNALAGCDE